MGRLTVLVFSDNLVIVVRLWGFGGLATASGVRVGRWIWKTSREKIFSHLVASP